MDRINENNWMIVGEDKPACIYHWVCFDIFRSNDKIRSAVNYLNASKGIKEICCITAFSRREITENLIFLMYPGKNRTILQLSKTLQFQKNKRWVNRPPLNLYVQRTIVYLSIFFYLSMVCLFILGV